MWHKMGLIYKDRWAQLPTVIEDGDKFRIYFASRCKDNRSRIFGISVGADTSKNVHRSSSIPVLDVGKRGCFDDAGVMPSCIRGSLLIYTGWNLDKGAVPYGHGIGVATLDEMSDRWAAVRLSDGPILDRSPTSPYLVNSGVLNGEHRMWVCNGSGWDGNFPHYGLQLAQHSYGAWQVDKYKEPVLNEPGFAYSRPAILNIYPGPRTVLWTARRTKDTPYVMMAYKSEGLGKRFEPAPEFTIHRSEDGWDSEMIAYPAVVRRGKRLFMFYNGNNYGETGIGVAEWIGDML